MMMWRRAGPTRSAWSPEMTIKALFNAKSGVREREMTKKIDPVEDENDEDRPVGDEGTL